MGVKHLNGFLRQRCEHVFERKGCIELREKKIAYDASLFVCQMKISRTRTQFIETVVRYLNMMKNQRNSLVFVFDGLALKEKAFELDLRRRSRQRQHDLLVRHRHELQQMEEGLKDVDDARLEAYKARMKRRTDSVRRMESMAYNVVSADFEALRVVLDRLSIPTVKAVTEGEFLCAQLCKDGVVDTVYSRDTDVLACLSPSMITQNNATGFKEVRSAKILEALDMSAETWLDFCIMCGTDFNRNMETIDMDKAYSLMRQYKSIDNLPSCYPTEVLNHVRIREIYNTRSPLRTPILFDTVFAPFDDEDLQSVVEDALAVYQMPKKLISDLRRQ